MKALREQHLLATQTVERRSELQLQQWPQSPVFDVIMADKDNSNVHMARST